MEQLAAVLILALVVLVATGARHALSREDAPTDADFRWLLAIMVIFLVALGRSLAGG